MIYIHRIALRSALGSDSERTLSRLADPEPFPETPVADAPGRSGADFEPLAARWGKDVSPEPVTRGFLLVRDAAEEILSGLDPAVREEVLASLSVVLGNATSGLNEALDAARRGDSDEILRAPLELGKVSAQLARSIGASGPDLTISTACTASGKALCEAARHLLTGDVEYALAGGMDVLNPFTDAGFHALGAQSDVRSKPLAAERSGLHLGEGPSFCSRRNRRWAAFRRCARFRAGAKRATRTTSPPRTPKGAAPSKRWPRRFPARK